jgi:hypothetical protein
MGMVPQPTQSPLPPAPPRSSSNVLAIALLVLGLIILLSGIALWGGLRFLTRAVKVHVSDGADRKEVSIKTPFGGIEVNKGAEVTAANLGLPIYPGAKPLTDDGSASVSLGLPGENSLHIVAAKFETSDSFAKVRDFYQNRLTATVGPFTKKGKIDSDHDELDKGEMGNFFGVDSDGKTVFKIKRQDDERVAALKDEWGSTRIELVRVRKNSGEAN